MAAAGPQTVAEVEQLVKQLYKAGSPGAVRFINSQLQALQLSPDGWNLADQLMASTDANVRFFAALTFSVKLNNEGPSLNKGAAQTVLTRLIFWLIQLVHQGEGSLVCKKLCSTLTTYFLRSPVPWTRPLLHLAASLHQEQAITGIDIPEDGQGLELVLPNLTPPQLRVLLWFAGSLAEETGKTDVNLPAHARSHSELEVTIKDVSLLVKWCLEPRDAPESKILRAAALDAFNSWINYAQPAWPHSPEPLRHLRTLVEPAAQSLYDPDLQTTGLDVFKEILEGYTTFLQSKHVEMLSQLIDQHIKPILVQGLANRDPDVAPFAQLVIAFGCAYIEPVVEKPTSVQNSMTIIQLHIDMLSAPGYPGDDDTISVQSIEFWNTYIEYINDTIYSQEDEELKPPWLQEARGIASKVVELLWMKLWIPTSDVKKGWGDTETEAFKDFRMDASDLMLSMFVFLGTQMLEQLATYTLSSLESKQWRAVEAALFCLNALADNVLEDASSADLLGGIFRSSLFRDIADFSQPIPLQARRTAIDILGSYGQYIERHAEFLPDTLRFLFASLETSTMSSAAAKSVGSLCSTCRVSLTGELDGFMQQYQRFLISDTADAYAKEKVIGAIAAIVQALTPENAKARPLLFLLDFIDKDIIRAQECASRGEKEAAESLGVSALECLASIGKGLQVPDDIPIDIYDEEDPEARATSYWQGEEGLAIQQRIIGCFSVLQVVGNSSAGIDAACQVFKSGFTETIPGPFVLPPSVLVSFIQQCNVGTPQLESVLSTAGTLIAQHSRSKAKRIDPDVAAICGCAIGFMQVLGKAMNDPAVAMACITIMTLIMPVYTHVMLGDQASSILDFTLSAIEGNDTLSKRAAAEFWARFLKPSTAANVPETQDRAQQLVQAYASMFVGALARQICGQAQRSELDYLCEPLRVLLMEQPQAQAWLMQAITTDPMITSGARLGVKDREKFIRQLATLRSDNRRTKMLVKAFWAECRGTVASYTA